MENDLAPSGVNFDADTPEIASRIDAEVESMTDDDVEVPSRKSVCFCFYSLSFMKLTSLIFCLGGDGGRHEENTVFTLSHASAFNPEPNA